MVQEDDRGKGDEDEFGADAGAQPAEIGVDEPAYGRCEARGKDRGNWWDASWDGWEATGVLPRGVRVLLDSFA